jgi:outer membrane protein TolC
MPRFLPFARLLACGALLACAALAQTGPPLQLTLQDALTRARTVNPQWISANLSALIAHEDSVQAKAALRPTAQAFSQFIYTQPNGTPSGVFVPNDGPHIYNDQAQVHGDIYAPLKRADYRRAMAAEAVAKAKADVAARGIVATVSQNYYGMAVGSRKAANARTSLAEAQRFLDITTKLEGGGEAAHVDVIKAQIQVEQRQRDVQDAELAAEKARIGLAVLIFTDFRQDFSVVDDLEGAAPLRSASAAASLIAQGPLALNYPNCRTSLICEFPVCLLFGWCRSPHQLEAPPFIAHYITL